MQETSVGDLASYRARYQLPYTIGFDGSGDVLRAYKVYALPTQFFIDTEGRIVGGEELGWPRDAKVVRRSGVSDGPYIETKELLGGFIVLEVPDEATALEVASGWPALLRSDCAVEIRPVGDSTAEAGMR